ncbi:hypothetical protein SUVZ_15G0010 [Saccharomyces uvarum]|uniref:EF-hand domain-containing protein n=1 Tax=Saccharomyces uvarum TaxID=230603 RepID=A0ABN8WLW1_SACUV|nr:hypothetical protein SUVZ_15G0010 [Saccharomyces uvarum]
MLQQVMSPAINHEKCLGIKLSGQKDFKKWYKTLLRYTACRSEEWNEYVRDGGMQMAIQNYSLDPARELNTRILFNDALFSLIQTTSEGNALDFVNEVDERCDGTLDSRSLLEQLNKKYGIENNFFKSEPWSRLHLVLKSDINERIKYAKEMANVCYDLNGQYVATLTPEQKTIFEEAQDVKRNEFISYFLLALVPDARKYCLNYVGNKTTIHSTEVISLVEAFNESNVSNTPTETAMYANKKNRQKKKPYKCLVCGGNHRLLQDCDVLKKLHPDAPVFKIPVPSEKHVKPSAWIANEIPISPKNEFSCYAAEV